ncbi:MAG TPA: hypothetical protein PK289_14505, partial [Bacteroidia bacterium]|nr:hypothetical protein [Bacteroidia bacterium]
LFVLKQGKKKKEKEKIHKFQRGKTPEMLQAKHCLTLIKITRSHPTPLTPPAAQRIRKIPFTTLLKYALILHCDFNANIVTMRSSSPTILKLSEDTP